MVEGAFQSSARLFNRAGLSPNSLTLLGLLLTIIASLLYATGLGAGWEWAVSLIALLMASYFDAVDGAMARKYGRISRVGGVLDSVSDRIGEIFLYSGLAVGGLISYWLALWALSASLMVSYVRARVSLEGVALKGVGVAERPERLLILIVATSFFPLYGGILTGGVLLVAILASVTVVERLYRTSRTLLAEAEDSQNRLSSRDRTLETPK